MPVYQYACTECGERLEVRQSFTDDPLAVCPQCDGRLRKVLTPVGVVFKGPGFYRTDSRTASNGSSGAGSSAAAASRNGSTGKEAGAGSAAGAGKATGQGSAASSAPSADGSGSKAPSKAAATP